LGQGEMGRFGTELAQGLVEAIEAIRFECVATERVVALGVQCEEVEETVGIGQVSAFGDGAHGTSGCWVHPVIRNPRAAMTAVRPRRAGPGARRPPARRNTRGSGAPARRPSARD